MTMNRRLLLPLLLLLAVLLPGCLEFDSQDVFLHYDPAQDQLDLLFVYRGLHADTKGDQTRRIEEAVEHLEEAQQSGAFAFWSNYPWRLRPRHDRTHMQLLLPHLQVENGPLFKDADGRLCGYQLVRFSKVKKLLDKVNTVLSLMLETRVLTKGDWPLLPDHEVDDESRDRITDFLRGRGQVLRLRDACLELQLPLSEPDSRWLREQVARSLLRDLLNELDRAKASEPNAEVRLFEQIARTPTFQLLASQDVSWVREAGMTRLQLGVPGQPQQTLRSAAKGSYDPALLKALEARKVAIGPELTEAELLKRFGEFHGRAAVLPPELAAMAKK